MSESSNPLRTGFQEVLRDPALLLTELAWRWSFGLITIFVSLVSGFILFGTVQLNSRRLEAMSAFTPWQQANELASTLVAVGPLLVRVVIVAAFVLAFCWIVLSSIGRRATLARPGFALPVSFRFCLVIQSLRATCALGSIVAWIAAGLLAGLLVGGSGKGAVPRAALAASILLPALVIIVSAWATANWILSIAPLFPGERWTDSMLNTWKWCRCQREKLFEIGIVIGVLRGVLLAIALMISIAVSTVVTNTQIAAADLIAITLLYFLIADFLYVGRLAAFVKLKNTALQQQLRPADPGQVPSEKLGLDLPVSEPSR
jgi:hypothetical protein